MKSFLYSIAIAILLISMASCNNNYVEMEEIPAISETVLPPSTQEFKDAVVEKLPTFIKYAEKASSRANMPSDEDEIEARRLCSSLAAPLVNMLKSHGFTDADWTEFESQGDPSFILAGIIYLALFENNVMNNVIPLSRALSEGGGGDDDDDDECWDIARVASCAATALGIKDVVSYFKGIPCITKNIAFSVIKTIVPKVLGGALSAIIVIANFSVCMGWIG